MNNLIQNDNIVKTISEQGIQFVVPLKAHTVTKRESIVCQTTQLFWALTYHNKAISKVLPLLSFEGKTKTKTVLKPAYKKV